MTDLISRADAIEAVEQEYKIDRGYMADDYTYGFNQAIQYVSDIILQDLPSAEAEPKMTEEVREALMRLTMCAREECGMCKYKDECGFDFQYKISTENMHTILDALSADAVSRKDTVTLNSPISIQAEMVAVVRCKDCRYFKKIVERSDSGLCHKDIVASAWKENGYCSRGERRQE